MNRKVPSGVSDSSGQIERFLTTDAMCRILACSRTTLWRQVRAGHCVQPVQLSPGRVGFPESEVREYIRQLMDGRGEKLAGATA